MKSSYQVSVSILFPVNGVARKEDRKTLGEVLTINDRATHILKFFRNKERMVSEFSGKLVKEYEVLVITDAQFGKMDLNKHSNDWKKAALAIATSKQKSEMFLIS